MHVAYIVGAVSVGSSAGMSYNLTHLHCPDTGSGSDVQNTARVLDWSRIQLVANSDLDGSKPCAHISPRSDLDLNHLVRDVEAIALLLLGRSAAVT